MRPGGRSRGDGALSIEARWLQPDVPPELDQTYRRTFARLKGLFRARGCTPEEAADLAQEAAMRAYVHVRRWGVSGEALDPLINRIARNLLIDRHRRAAPHLVPLDAAEEVHDPADDPDELVLRRQRNVEVRSAVSELPERHRTAIMYSLKGMTPAEVADKLGIGRNAADALLHRARRSLRERLRHVGDGMLGLSLWVGSKLRGGARRAGLDGSLAVGGVAVESGSALLAAAVFAVVASFGAGGAGGIPEGRTVAAKALHASAAEAAPMTPAPVGKTRAADAPPTEGPGGVALGPAGFDASGPDGRGNYLKGSGSVDHPDDGREILGFGPNVFRQSDDETMTSAADAVCSRASGCEILYRDPRP